MNISFRKENIKKVLKRTGITLCTGSLIGIASFKAYDTYIDKRLKKIEISDASINDIKGKYNNDIVIFTMNDSQGINLNIGFYKKSYPEYLEESLGAKLVDSSSLLYNKTSHIDMVLDNNLSLGDVKRVNNKGARAAFEKIAIDINKSMLQGLFGTVGEKVFGSSVNEEDNSVYITDLLRNTKQPIVIYSSGANNIMYQANFNPNSVCRDANGDFTENYLYAKKKLSDEETINKVITGIEDNFKHILSINQSAKIIALSIYVPSSFEDDDYSILRDAIKDYNKKLEELCRRYNIGFINEEELGRIYNNSKFNFHIDEVGHKELASLLVDEISNNLDEEPMIVQDNYPYSTNGLAGYYRDLVEEIEKVELPSNDNYSYIIYECHVDEKSKEAKICKELLKK